MSISPKASPPATALREATAHLRQHVEWEHPYYWAPFGVSGLAHGSVRAASSSNFQVKNEKKHIDTTKQEHKRGINPMNETQIMQQAIDLLEQISEDAGLLRRKNSAPLMAHSSCKPCQPFPNKPPRFKVKPNCSNSATPSTNSSKKCPPCISCCLGDKQKEIGPLPSTM